MVRFTLSVIKSAMVFKNHALYPHLNVSENIAFEVVEEVSEKME